MTIYIANRADKIVTVEVSEDFRVLITDIEDEGVPGSAYEEAAEKLRQIGYDVIDNPCEAYLSYEDAEIAFDPILGW